MSNDENKTVSLSGAMQQMVPEVTSQPAKEVGSFAPQGYSNLQEIGKGGMGKIYRATQDSLGRDVAIKVMHFPDDDEGVQRFMMEASILAQLDHPNIIRVFDFGQSDGMMYLVMELVEGDTLKQHVLKHGALSVQEFMLVSKQLVGALLEAHQQKVIHRDIKPSNVLLRNRQGKLFSKLIDFGLVKNLSQSVDLSMTGAIMGSPLYMAPEQLLSTPVDDRTDIYALGLMFYFLLTGNPPFAAKEMMAVFRCQIDEDPKPMISVRGDLAKHPNLCWMVQTMYQKKAENRFQNVQQLMDALTYIEQHMISGDTLSLDLSHGQLIYTTEGKEQRGDKPNPFMQQAGNSIANEATQAINPADLDPSEISRSGVNTIRINPQPTAQNNNWIFVVLVVILVAAGGWYSRSLEQKFTEVSSVSQEVVKTSKVLLSSSPSGAEVFQEGGSLGVTPLSVELHGDEQFTVTLKLDGYEDKNIRVTRSVLNPSIVLDPIKASDASKEKMEAQQSSKSSQSTDAAQRSRPQAPKKNADRKAKKSTSKAKPEQKAAQKPEKKAEKKNSEAAQQQEKQDIKDKFKNPF